MMVCERPTMKNNKTAKNKQNNQRTMMTRLKTHTLLALCCILSLIGNAAVENTSSRISGAQVQTGAAGSVEDTKYNFMTTNINWSSQFTNKSVNGYLQVGIDRLIDQEMESDFELELQFTVTPYNTSGQAQSTISVSLYVDHLNSHGVTEDKNSYRLAYHKFKWTLDDVLDVSDEQNPVSLTVFPENLYIESTIIVDRLYDFDHTILPANLQAAVTNTNELQISWGYIPGVEEYELEWSFVNSYDGTPSGTLASSTIDMTDIDFSHNNTRITTTSQHYNVALVYEKGYLIYRVRGKGWAGTSDHVIIPGKWSSDNGVTKVNVDDWPAIYTISTVHENLLNWQYQANYAENGKKKESVSYTDGSGRVRQAIARINTDNTVLVGETFYDHQGRPGIQTIPAPSGTTYLQYHEDFNKNSDGIPATYTRDDFDVDDNINNCAPAVTSTMSDQFGSSKYFSTNATQTNDFQDYVPDANDYPFTQTEYMPDNTGRIRRQSMPGDEHELGSDHEMKNFYGQAKQEEVDRLFGTNIGESTRYQKNMVVDPNGQISVTYVDPYGRTVATALAGDAPTNLDTLSYQNTVSMDVDLLNKTATTDVDDTYDDNILVSTGRFNFPVDDALEATRQELVTSDQIYDFEYDMTSGKHTDPCMENICYPYVYDLEISVQDLCGSELLEDNASPPIVYGVNEVSIGDLVDNDCTGPTYNNVDLSADLDVGEYNIYKKIQVNEEAVDLFAAAYLEDDTCLLTLTDFQNQAETELDTDDCEMTCEECLVESYDGFHGAGAATTDGIDDESTLAEWDAEIPVSGITAEDWSSLYTLCMGPCTQPTLCEVAYLLMLKDVSPGGQWWTDDVTGIWDDGRIYYDSDGSASKITVSEIAPGVYDPPVKTTPAPTLTPVGINTYETDPEDLLLFSDFELYWRDSWALSLVTAHREYCYYEACIITEEVQSGESVSSFDFDEQLRGYASFSAAATGLGISSLPSTFDVDNIIDALLDNDPFFEDVADVTPGKIEAVYNDGQTPTPVAAFLTDYYPNMGINIKTAYNNYLSSTMFDLGLTTAQCGTYFGTNSGCTTNAGSATTAEKDLTWDMIVGFYISEKQNIMQLHRHYIAADHSPSCYNWDIGVANGLEDKEKRFPDNSDIMNALETGLPMPPDAEDFMFDMNTQAGNNHYNSTGQCPIAYDLQNFLTTMAEDGNLDASSAVALTTVPDFTPRLYSTFFGTALDQLTTTDFEALQYSASVVSNDLHILIDPVDQGETGDCESIILDDHYLSSLPGSRTWSTYGPTGTDKWEVVEFKQLTPTGFSSGTYTFDVLAIIDLDPGGTPDLKEVVFGGSTCAVIDDCEFDVCEDASAHAEDIAALLYELSTSNDLTSTTAIALHGGNYQAIYEGSLLQAKFGPNAYYYKTAAAVGVFSKNSTTTSTTNGDLEVTFSEDLVDLLDSEIYSDGVTAQSTGEFNILHLEAVLTSATTADITYFTATIEEELTGEGKTPFDVCCDADELDISTALETFLQDLADGTYVSGNSYVYTGIPTAMATLLGQFGQPTDDVDDEMDITLSSDELLLVPSEGLTPECTWYFTEDGSAYTFTPASIDLIYGAHISANFSETNFMINILHTDNTVHTVMVETCFDLTTAGCDVPCTPIPLAPLSCEEEWEELEDYFTDVSVDITVPKTVEISGTDLDGDGILNDPVEVDFEAEFCERQMKYHVDVYIDYLTVTGLDDEDVNWIDFETFCNMNNTGEMALWVAYLEDLDGLSQMSLAIDAQTFVNGNYAACSPTYIAELTTSNFTDGIEDFCVGLDDWFIETCNPSFPYGDFPDADVYPNLCDTLYTQLATINAQTAYDQYIEQVLIDFKIQYIEGAIAALKEQFTMEYDDDEFHHTLYYYDQSGNLVRTIPPQGIDETFFTNVSGNVSSLHNNIKSYRDGYNYGDALNLAYLPDHGFATTYKYNTLNQLQEQKTPDGGVSWFFYDQLSRLVLSQNAKQANGSNYASGDRHYSYTIYDELGRIVEVGEIEELTALNTMSGTTLQDELADIADGTSVNNLYDWITDSGLEKYDVVNSFYDRKYLPMSLQTTAERGELRNRITATTYTEKITSAAATSPYDQIQNGTTSITNLPYNRASHYSYDIHGNVSTLVHEFADLVDLGHKYFRIDYSYDLVSGNVHQVAVRDIYDSSVSGNSTAVPVVVPDNSNLGSNGLAFGGWQNGTATEDSRAPFYYRYEYDADNRITAAYTSHDGENWTRDAKYLYYQHGPLARTELGEQLQGTDMIYTMHGWLKGVNANQIDAAEEAGKDGHTSGLHRAFGQDAMGFTLNYYSGDYSARQTYADDFLTDLETNLRSQGTYDDLYNGNIGMMATALTDQDEEKVELIGNHYRYDQLNRIKEMVSYQSGIDANYSYSNASGNSDDYYTEYSYDRNGNLITLERHAHELQMDNLHYWYLDESGTPFNPTTSIPTDATNRLAYVTDNGTGTGSYTTDLETQSSGNYDYDEIGQLIQDNSEEIETIEWLPTHKVSKVTRSASSTKDDLEFKYDANGNRTIKIVKPRNGTTPTNQDNWTYTYYVRDAQGNVLTTYTRELREDGEDDYLETFSADEHHIYGSKRLGLQLPNNPEGYHGSTYAGFTHTGTQFVNGLFDYAGASTNSGLLPSTTSPTTDYLAYTIGDKVYECSNHLGNVLATITDRKFQNDIVNSDNISDIYYADVLSYSDYYPFGMLMPGRNGNSGDYRYGFQGQEKDDELKGEGNSVNYKFRMHDSRVGRFFAEDPLASKFAFNSPYTFSQNLVISAVELEGLEAKIAIHGESTDFASFKKSDNPTFKNRATRLKKHGFKALYANTGMHIVTHLCNATEKEGAVRAAFIFSHGFVSGVVLDNNKGLYNTDQYNEEGAATIDDIVSLMEQGEVKFNDDAVIFLGICSPAYGIAEKQENFATSLNEGTKATIIASDDLTSPEKKVGEDGKEYSTGRITTDGNWWKIESGYEVTMTTYRENGSLLPSSYFTTVKPVFLPIFMHALQIEIKATTVTTKIEAKTINPEDYVPKD
jgi:RHS repeat-associated protein